VVCLPRRVPQDVKLKVSRQALVRSLKQLNAREHDFLGDRQSDLWVLRVSAGLQFGPELKTGNFAARHNGTVVIAAFNHGKRRPAIHCFCLATRRQA